MEAKAQKIRENKLKHVLIQRSDDGVVNVCGIFRTMQEIADALCVSVHVCYRIKEGFYTRRVNDALHKYQVTKDLSRYDVVPLSALPYLNAG